MSDDDDEDDFTPEELAALDAAELGMVPEIGANGMDMQTALDKLRQVFGFTALRPGQSAVIASLLRGENALAVFPTGGGKSICYQLPALLFPGLTVVVCPLISLMLDQCTFLTSKGIVTTLANNHDPKGVSARFLNSTLSKDDENQVFADLQVPGKIKLLYVAPERFKNEFFVGEIQRVQIDLFVIDEAHCISEWGHSFRPSYLLLKRKAQELPIKRILCCTATASQKVAVDVLQAFSIPKANLSRTQFYRANLHLDAEVVSDKVRDQKILDSLQQDLANGSPYRGSGIIYVTTQNDTDRMSALLENAGYKVKTYHAGMQNELRTKTQSWFMSDQAAAGKECRIVCATIAFGMGIDKSDIRFVYHANVSKSLEGYSQEIGRGGRDGKPTICRTFICPQDLPLLESFALGKTPTMTGVRKMLDTIFLSNGAPNKPGTVVEVNHYQLGKDCDITPSAVNLILCHLDYFGRHVDVMSNIKRDRVMSRYRIRRQADYDALVQEIYDRQRKHETDELARLSLVLETLTSQTQCVARVLMRYFGEGGEKDDWKCGNCQACNDKKLAFKRIGATGDLGVIETTVTALWTDLGTLMASDECRAGVRFLLGIPSPSLRTHKKHPSFGKFAGACDFVTLLDIIQAHAAKLAQNHPKRRKL